MLRAASTIGVLLSCLIAAFPVHARVDPSSISDVHVIFSNHLDVGFDGISPVLGYSRNVVNKYFDIYFPLAVRTAAAMRQLNGTDRYVWMTQSWLVSMYFDCPIGMDLHCPTEDAKATVRQAIARGDITWHAFPFNSELETSDPDMIADGFALTHEVDDRFGVLRKRVMSQRDVPGTTRSVIPILRARGIDAISFGVNGFSAPPDLPTAFVWRDGVSGTDIIGMVHPGGYGGITLDDAVLVPGLSHALIMDWRGDNRGPAPDVEEVIGDYAAIRAVFPNANVYASTFDAFVTELETVRVQLPVFTSEIGDTWVHGVASDPLKLAQFRAVMRLRSECIATPHCDSTGPVFRNFSRLLLKNNEHTWGGDVKTFLNSTNPDGAYYQWSNQQFASAYANDKQFGWMMETWIEQRRWGIEYAVAALKMSNPAHELHDRIIRAFDELKVGAEPQPLSDGYVAVTFDTVVSCGSDERAGYNISFSSLNGGINQLLDRESMRDWSSDSNSLGVLSYQSFNETDFVSFAESYGYCDLIDCPWALYDFGKHGLNDAANPVSQLIAATPLALYMRRNDHDVSTAFWVSLSFPPSLVADYGAPASAWVHVDVPHRRRSREGIRVTVQWFNKTSTRMPESIWFSFNPVPAPQLKWEAHKSGEWIDAFDVIRNGSAHNHAVQFGVRATDPNPVVPAAAGDTIQFSTIDAAFASFGVPNPFPTPLGVQPDMTANGVNYGLVNNIWGTNYVMWYPFVPEDANSQFRFEIHT